jgi:hypothetical protein
MADRGLSHILSEETMEKLFPRERTDQFFESLLGDALEGPYDIALRYRSHEADRLHLEFHLTERPGKCLTCSVTYGLPHVFSRHPVIDVKDIVRRIGGMLDGNVRCGEWKLGMTREISNKLHIIPLTVFLEDAS